MNASYFKGRLVRSLTVALTAILPLLIASPAFGDVPDNSVTSAKIVDGAIRSADIANRSIKTVDIADGAITRRKLRNSAVTSAKILNGSIAGADVATGAIDGSDIENDSLGSADIEDGSIAGDDIEDGSIDANDIEDGSISAEDIEDGGLDSDDIEDESIDTSAIADGAITTAKLAADIGVLLLGEGYSGGDQLITDTMSFDATYATGGESVTTTVGEISSVMIVPSKGGYVFEIDESSFTAGSFKVKAMQTGSTTGSPLSQVAGGTDLSAIEDVRYQVIGQ